MRTLLLTTLFLLLTCMGLPAKSQKKYNLFADFDLFLLKGTGKVSGDQKEKLPRLIRYDSTISKKFKRLTLISGVTAHSKSRKAIITKNRSGTIIAFNLYKSKGGYEKVFIFGSSEHYLDSILLRNDTVFYKHLSQDDLTQYIILPELHDILTILKVYKSYRYNDSYLNDKWISLSHYAEWFAENNSDKRETHTLVKKDDHYELIRLTTSTGEIRDYQYQMAQDDYRRSGLSIFWMVVGMGIYF